MAEPIKIEVIGEFAKPSDQPVAGNKRLVRHLPFGMPGTAGMLLPCIWTSPYEIYDEDLKENVKVCILLLSKGPPRPEIVAVRIPTAAIEKFSMAPVEW